jgi:hypothetical protein
VSASVLSKFQLVHFENHRPRIKFVSKQEQKQFKNKHMLLVLSAYISIRSLNSSCLHVIIAPVHVQTVVKWIQKIYEYTL